MSRIGESLRMGGHFARARWAFTHLRGPALHAYQDRRARRMAAFAVRHSPFYRTHWAGYDLMDWRSLPTVDKRQMMDNFDRFNTTGVSYEEAMAVALRAEANRDFTPTVGKGLTVGLSSGTSGHRGLFLVSSAETAAWAGTILARTLPGIPAPGYRVALFLRSNSNLYERLGASRRVIFRWFDLMTAPNTAVNALNDFAPHLLVGPPSLLLMLADAAAQNTLRIKPQRLLSVAEVLEPQDQQRLETAFDTSVGQIYQCTEGLLAVSCLHGRLHIQEDLVAVQHDPLSPSDPLRVTPLITDLWRQAQPIVRYRMGDVLRLAPPKETAACACGSAFAVIEAVEGRCDDTCWFEANAPPNGPMVLRPFFPDTIRRMVLLSDARISEYAAVQARPGHLRVFLETQGDAAFDAAADAVRESAVRTVTEYGCRPPIIEIEQGIPPTPAGTKRRRVRCLHADGKNA